MKAKVINPSRQDLERKIMELESQLSFLYHFACASVGKASIDHLMGSGVVLRLNVLGGREIFSPVCIRDGLSKETIEAIQKDLVRSYELATAFKPVIK